MLMQGIEGEDCGSLVCPDYKNPAINMISLNVKRQLHYPSLAGITLGFLGPEG
jgi:hypothetical protein